MTQNYTLTIQLAILVSLTSPTGNRRETLALGLEFHHHNQHNLNFTSTGVVAIICNFSSVIFGFILKSKCLLTTLDNTWIYQYNLNKYILHIQIEE